MIGWIIIIIGGICSLPSVLAPFVLRRELARLESAILEFDQNMADYACDDRMASFIRGVIVDTPLMLTFTAAGLVDVYSFPHREQERDRKIDRFISENIWVVNTIATVKVSHDIVAFYSSPLRRGRFWRFLQAITLLRVCSGKGERVTTVDMQTVFRILEATSRTKSEARNVDFDGHVIA